MIPVHQTRFGRPEGNCLSAAIASVLEVPLEALAEFDEWHRAASLAAISGTDPPAGALEEVLARVLYRLGWAGAWLSEAPAGYCVVLATKAEDPTTGHAWVLKDGHLAHDPNPLATRAPGISYPRVENYLGFLPFARGPRQ